VKHRNPSKPADCGRRRALRGLLAAGCATLVFPAARADAAQDRREDFDALWSAIETRYAYIGERRAAWKRARDAFRARALAAGSRDELARVLERMLATLRDDHISLSPRAPRSPRRVPQETDVWALWRDGSAVIESVRVAGDADYAGVRPGEIVGRIDAVPVAEAVARHLGEAHDASAHDRDWALRHLLAGPRQGTLALDLAGPDTRHVEIERSGIAPAVQPPLLARRMGEDRDIGYIRLKTPTEARLAEHFDAALGPLADARALVLDLRDATDGIRAVTLGVLARLAKREGVWQVRLSRTGHRVVDRIAPAGAPYPGPVAVLVDRWTAGEGEALAAGLAAVADARLVGTPMARMRGELHEVRLPHSGIVVRFPGEKVLLVDGTPREALRPAVAIDPAAPSGGPGDPILYQALKLLEK
jgi:carboxyl-terminal processing protease